MSGSLLVFGVVLPWLFVAVCCWLGYQLVRQNGRILLQLEALQDRIGTPAPAPQQEYVPPAGLPVGSEAPAFELPDLSGRRKALSGFRGKRLLLIFFNPGCGYCVRMAPGLAALPADGADGKPVPLVVSTGDAAANRKLVEEHGIRCPVLLQEQMEVASQYQAGGTPMGYLIDAEGKIAGEMAIGAEALLALADPLRAAAPAAAAQPTAPNGNGNGHHQHQGNRSLDDSHIERNGLSAGTPAPDFRLPRVDGGELSLAEYRGRRVLLVFSSPDCGPCDALSPQLEHLARRIPEVQVLMVSRGSMEANEAKATQHGLTFPVAVQRQWEISRQYAMFATPIAYLIDEEGTIVSDVVTGMEPILLLLARAAVPTNGRMPEVAAPAHAGEAARRRA